MHFFELMSFLFITSNEQFNESGTTVKCVKKDPLLLLYNLKKITLSCACQNTPILNVFQVKIQNKPIQEHPADSTGMWCEIKASRGTIPVADSKMPQGCPTLLAQVIHSLAHSFHKAGVPPQQPVYVSISGNQS